MKQKIGTLSDRKGHREENPFFAMDFLRSRVADFQRWREIDSFSVNICALTALSTRSPARRPLWGRGASSLDFRVAPVSVLRN